MTTFFFFLRSREKIFVKTFHFIFFLESTCACVLGLGAFLFLASRVSVLGKAVLGHWPRIFFVSLALASSLVSSTPPLIKIAEVTLSSNHRIN